MEKDPSQVSRLATLKNNQAKLEEELLVAYR